MRRRTLTDALFVLWRGGMHFSGVIDAGCADGHFGLRLAEQGPARTSTVLNIDAQQDYAAVLEEISSTMGWHHRICALGEKDGGTLKLVRGVHPYWTSPRPQDDPYWSSLRDLHANETIEVPQRTIDALVMETLLPGPYLIKLDVQGAETAALRGAKRALRNTEAVIVEVQLEDFRAIHEVLDAAGFLLFDLSEVAYSVADSLSSFYATYVAGRRRNLLRGPTWEAGADEKILGLMEQRRGEMRRVVGESLARYRAGQWPPLED